MEDGRDGGRIVVAAIEGAPMCMKGGGGGGGGGMATCSKLFCVRA